MRVTDTTLPFRLLKGMSPPIHVMVLPNQSLRPKLAIQTAINTASGLFSDVLEIPSEKAELSWKGSKIIGIFTVLHEPRIVPKA